MKPVSTLSDKALKVANARGIARARDFREAGIPLTYLKRLCDSGKLVRLGRGIYQRSDFDNFHAGHDLAEAARLVPNGVVCLLSALRLHGLTTQLPHKTWLTIGGKARAPRHPSCPLEIVRASGDAFSEGRMTVNIEGVEVPVFNPAKTVADCFKYRRRVGLDVAVEALRDVLKFRKATRPALWHYAGVCRVQPLMRPYLEALT